MPNMPRGPSDQRAAILALEAQRALLGDDAVDAALAVLRRASAEVQAEDRQELKQVTILFADIVGSTSISQALDPEDIHEALDGLLAQLATCVHDHGGLVLKYMGDGVMAGFGVAGVREDDAARAVRCGLELVERAQVRALSFPAAHPMRALELRVGIHTGRVLVGGGVDGGANIRGMAVNIAARMEQIAPPGRVRISTATLEHVRREFEVEPQPDLRVKGYDKPVQSALVVRPHAAMGDGEATALYGRVHELERLEAAWSSVDGTAQPMFRCTLIVGEAGTGKSRLLREFRRRCGGGVGLCLDTAGFALRASDPYGLLRNLLRVAAGQGSQAGKTKAESLRAVIASAGENAQALAALLGLAEGGRSEAADVLHLRNAAFRAATLLLAAAGTRSAGGTLILIDGLQDCDPGSLEFLDYYRSRAEGARTLLLASGRPSVLRDHATWIGAVAAETIRLAPLSPEETLALAGTLLGTRAQEDPGVCSLIVRRSEGNPFFVEELVNMLHGGADHARVPQTLVGVVEARLDRLVAADKRAIQQASVIGPSFEMEALRAIDPAALHALDSLQRLELIFPAGPDGGDRFEFRHPVLQEVAYDTLLRHERQLWHERLADRLAAHPRSDGNDHLALVAHHYDRAGCEARACEYHARAAEHESALFAHHAALAHVKRGLELATGTDRPALAMRWRLLEVRERTFDLLGRRAEQMADATGMAEIAGKLDDALSTAKATLCQAAICGRQRDPGAQARFARRSMAAAERAGSREMHLRAKRHLAEALSDLGDPAGEKLAADGVEEARSAGLRLLEGQFLNVLSVNASIRDDLATSLELERRQLCIFREVGLRRFEGSALANLGNTLMGLGALDEAGRSLDEALRLARGMGDRHAEAYMLNNLARLALCRGLADEARAWAEQAVRVAIVVDDPEFHAVALCRLGDARLALGDAAQARLCFDDAARIGASQDSGVRWDACSGGARCALHTGDVAGAMAILVPLLRHLESGGSMEGVTVRPLVELTCFEVLRAAGDPRAGAMLRQAHEALLERSAALRDPALHTSFMSAIPEHRAIVDAWARAAG